MFCQKLSPRLIRGYFLNHYYFLDRQFLRYLGGVKKQQNALEFSGRT